MFYSVVHFGKTYYENDSLFARSTHVFGCAQHQDQITCFDMENNYLVTGSINGDLKVWIHREESVEMNQDESFELAWSLKGVHKKQFLQKVAIVIPTSGYSKNPFIVSGGGQDGILLM
ncbi:predicted protein [Naegleria gruberi]|uniref:Predicted protein n=1 Tax=Naegleria gruberi TaxID=5762 RepID=D2VRI3_NAEGR|nr:uncharacterized protein NAEGRDRAFT_71596 [Naegleria gruberi]EFC40680.1 predicted protein [Naegleria gruberi]|eukprot:XP_002673424.1 predicted protein [Naegleria gruberi strain NEG-M]